MPTPSSTQANNQANFDVTDPNTWPDAFKIHVYNNYVNQAAQSQGYDDDINVSVTPVGVEAKGTEWLCWPGFLALGEFTELIGDPGMGKSSLTRLVAANVATGTQMTSLLKYDDSPIVHSDPARVLWVSMEESFERTLVPALQAAGMPENMWQYVNARRMGRGMDESHNTGGVLYLDESGVQRLRYTAQVEKCKLVVLDGSDGFLAPGFNDSKGSYTRFITNMLSDWAEEDNVAIILFRHEGKSSRTSGVHAGTGSTQWAAAARLAFFMGLERKFDKGSPIALAKTKDNLAPVNAIRVQITQGYALVKNNQTGQLENKSFGKAIIGEITDVTSDDMVKDESHAKKKETDHDKAIEVLSELLANGPMTRQDIKAHVEAQGIVSDRVCTNALRDERFANRKSQNEKGKIYYEWYIVEPNTTCAKCGKEGTKLSDDDLCWACDPHFAA